MNFQDVKTKTINWCSKMKDEGLITADQYDNCISTFMSSTSGIMPKSFKVPASGMPINYSLYNTRSESLTDNITGENTNTVMFVTNTGLTMACDSRNNIYYTKDINDPTLNQNHLYFTLNPQTDNVYGILSPYGRYLIANGDNTPNTADFSGTAIGPLSSWILNKVNDTVTLESRIYAGSFLTFIDKGSQLQVLRGEDESSQWKMIAKKQTSINDQFPQYVGTEYIALKENILTRIRNTAIDKIILDIIKNTLITLQDTISDNYSKLDKYMRNKLSYDVELYKLSSIKYKSQINSLKNSSAIPASALKSIQDSIPKPSGINLTTTQINSILFNIVNTKNTALKLIDEEISKINIQINNIPLGDPMDDYVRFMNNMNDELANITLRIQDNNIIMGRQKDNYDTLNKDVSYYDTRTNNNKKLDNSLKLNLNIIDGYKQQNTYIIYIYPLVFILFIFLLIYLIYITYQKFMTNVYTQY
jgi:hypothetical protein